MGWRCFLGNHYVHVKCSEGILTMLRVILLSALTLMVSATEVQDKSGADKAARTIGASGKQTYTHYCAACHGANARGIGPAAVLLKTPPPDLTTLAEHHGGKFPNEYVSDVLRFGTRIVARGSSDMPIWGPIFGSMESYDEVAVRKRIKELSDYLASLQEKES